jgi:hypothetical protein
MIISAIFRNWNVLIAARALCGVGVGGVMIMSLGPSLPVYYLAVRLTRSRIYLAD